MNKTVARRSRSGSSDQKITNDFREWLTREQIDDLVKKSKDKTLTTEEKEMLVEDMAYFGCTIQEIASMLNTTQPTISNNYRQVLNRAQTRWCYDLRKAQTFNGLYNRGNCTMLVWLGKQYLAQKDDPHNEMHQNTFDEFVQWMKTQVSSDSPPSS